MTCTLFGIEVTDRASRLIAADAAEDQALTELAAGLRDMCKPLVIEPACPPRVLPTLSLWKFGRNTPALPWRAASGFLARLMVRNHFLTAILQFVPAGYDLRSRPKSLRICELDLVEAGRARYVSRPTLPEHFQTAPGAALVVRFTPRTKLYTFYVCHDDVRRFGFWYFPAVLEERQP